LNDSLPRALWCANGAHFSATNGGILALIKLLALGWAGYGIRVNCVIPGPGDTAQQCIEMDDNELYAAGAKIRLGCIDQPSDIAAVVAFLLGDDAVTDRWNSGTVKFPLRPELPVLSVECPVPSIRESLRKGLELLSSRVFLMREAAPKCKIPCSFSVSRELGC
jgi:hypothetical protein